jgi:hypothetical protein
MGVTYEPEYLTNWIRSLGTGAGKLAGYGIDKLTNPYWGFQSNYLKNPALYITEYGLADNKQGDWEYYANPDPAAAGQVRAIHPGETPPPGFTAPIKKGWTAWQQWPGFKGKLQVNGTDAVTYTKQIDPLNQNPEGVQKYSQGGTVKSTAESELLRRILHLSGGTDSVPAALTPGEAVIPVNKVPQLNTVLKGAGYPGGVEQFIHGMLKLAGGISSVPYPVSTKKTTEDSNNIPGVTQPITIDSSAKLIQYQLFLQDTLTRNPKSPYAALIAKNLDTINQLPRSSSTVSGTVFKPITFGEVSVQPEKKQPPTVPGVVQPAGVAPLTPMPPPELNRSWTVPGTPGSPAQPAQPGFVPEGQTLDFNQAGMNAAGNDPAKIMQLFMNEAGRYGMPAQMPLQRNGTLDPNYKSPTDQKLELAGKLMGMYKGAQDVSPKGKDELATQETLLKMGVLEAQIRHLDAQTKSELGLSPKGTVDKIKAEYELKSLKQTMYLKSTQQALTELEKWQKAAEGAGINTQVKGNVAINKSYAMAAVKSAFFANPSLLTQTQNQGAILHGLPYANSIKNLLTEAEVNQIALDVTKQLSDLGMMPESITSSNLPVNNATTQGTGVTQGTPPTQNDPTAGMSPIAAAAWRKSHPGTGH